MKTFKTGLTPQQILTVTSGQWQGPHNLVLQSVCEPSEADGQSVIFCEQERLLEDVKSSSAGLIITNPDFARRLGDRALLIVEKPYLSLMVLISYWLKLDEGELGYQISPSATVDPTVRFLGKAEVGANAVIKANAVIGDGVRIGEGCVICEDVEIGAQTRFYPRVTVYDSCRIGQRCIIHSGVVIGADGFGFQLLGDKQQKIPQVGIVRIHDDVEIGANSTIDRATLGETVIGSGTKIDNLVQIGHNCVIGEHSILCAQVGLAGSTTVGDYVYLAGQVGAAGHITIGSRSMVGAQSGIAGSLPESGRYFGTPAVDANQKKRQIVAEKHLPDMYRAYQKTLKGDKN